MARRGNSWLKAGMDVMALSVEASQVIGLRTLKIAAGGPAADAEAARMVDEKVDAAWALQAMAFSGALGWTAPQITSKTIAHYRRRVRANRRRLSKA